MESITVPMLLDVKLEVDSDLKVAFDEHGGCFIVRTDADGRYKADRVEYVRPAEEPDEGPDEDTASDGQDTAGF